jgi:uncharacterized membrane protein YGL010W
MRPMRLPLPRHSLTDYMARYRAEHTKLGTKLTHMVGIPMIVASIPTAVLSPPLAGGLLAGGLALQFIGHHVFEKNRPAFLTDPYYALVGPVWVTAEWMQLLGMPVPAMFLTSEDEGHSGSGQTNGDGAAVAS